MLRTSSLNDTLRKYGRLTQAIAHCYRLQETEDRFKDPSVCPPFDGFVRKCNDLDKMTVGDVFAIQLMQVLTLLEQLESFDVKKFIQSTDYDSLYVM